jgi:hypothetical protein
VSPRVSYDVDVASHDRPEPGEPPDGVMIDGPFEVEPADLDEALAAAVLAPRWLLQVSGDRDGARRLGREIAERHGGAAYDRQEDAVFFPRGTPKRVPAGKAEKTSIVRLEWTLAEWEPAPAALIAALTRHAREGLPRRYDDVEPPQHRFENPAAFAAFARDHDAFWFASRPFFGGYSSPERQRLIVQLDRRVISADERWREAVVGLFAAVAETAGATGAEAYAERNWLVSANNRLSMYAGDLEKDNRGPTWLEWDGALIRHGQLPAERRSRTAFLRRRVR